MHIHTILRPSVGARFIAPTADYDYYHSSSVKVCHPEPIPYAQGKLREGSGARGTEMLRSAQHDKTDLGR